MSIPRRQFFAALASLPVGAAGCTRTTPASRSGPPDRALLVALADTVLPDELGATGRQRAVQEFGAWLAAYRPTAELNHGYGTGEIEYTPAHPGPGWVAQLDALDLEATQRFGASFAAIDIEQRRQLVRPLLARERGDRLPDPVYAHHVAVGLLAHFFGSSAANDLCHRAHIGQYQCRSLAESPRRPRSLETS